MNKNSLILLFALVAIATAATTTNNSGNFSFDFFANWSTVELYLVAVGLLGLGLVNLLFGLKYTKIIIFLIGFVMSATSTYTVEYLTSPNASQITAVLIALVSGVIGGCVFYFCYHCSIFTIGFGLGYLTVFSLSLTKIGESLGVLLLVVAFVVGIIGGIIALKVHNFIIILATSFAGSAYITLALSIFIERQNFFAVLQVGTMYRIIALCLLIVGIAYQYKNKDINQDDLHRDSVNSPDVYALDMNGHEAYNPYTGRKF